MSGGLEYQAPSALDATLPSASRGRIKITAQCEYQTSSGLQRIDADPLETEVVEYELRFEKPTLSLIGKCSNPDSLKIEANVADKDQKLVHLRNGAEWTEGNYILVLSGVNVGPIPIRTGPSPFFNIPITVKPPITDPPTVCGVTKLLNSFTVTVEWNSIMNTGYVISKSFDLDITVPIGN